MLKRLIGAGAAGLLALGLSLPAAAQQEPEFTFRIHQFLPAQAFIPRDFIVPWAEKVEAESNGRIKFEHYPSMQLGGSPPSLYDQVPLEGEAPAPFRRMGFGNGKKRFRRVRQRSAAAIHQPHRTLEREFRHEHANELPARELALGGDGRQQRDAVAGRDKLLDCVNRRHLNRHLQRDAALAECFEHSRPVR